MGHGGHGHAPHAGHDGYEIGHGCHSHGLDGHGHEVGFTEHFAGALAHAFAEGSHGGHHGGDHGWAVSHMIDLAGHGHEGGGHADVSDKPQHRIAIVENDLLLQLFVPSHRFSDCDVVEEIMRLAHKHGLLNVAPYLGVASCDMLLREIADMSALGYKAGIKPQGWEQGCTGQTRLFEQMYQTSGWRLFSPRRLCSPTYLKITGATWHFYRTGNSETCINFRVITPSVKEGASVCRKQRADIKRHSQIAETLAEEVNTYLMERALNS